MTPEGIINTHNLQCAEIEVHMEVLNTYSAFGYVLVNAYLIDEECRRTDLSIEAFDGQPIGTYMLDLERQYSLVLSP